MALEQGLRVTAPPMPQGLSRRRPARGYDSAEARLPPGAHYAYLIECHHDAWEDGGNVTRVRKFPGIAPAAVGAAVVPRNAESVCRSVTSSHGAVPPDAQAGWPAVPADAAAARRRRGVPMRAMAVGR